MEVDVGQRLHLQQVEAERGQPVGPCNGHGILGLADLELRGMNPPVVFDVKIHRPIKR